MKHLLRSGVDRTDLISLFVYPPCVYPLVGNKKRKIVLYIQFVMCEYDCTFLLILRMSFDFDPYAYL